MTKQELAKALHSIDWIAVQADDEYECEKLYQLVREIEKLSLGYAIRLLLHVVEVKHISSKTDINDPNNPFYNIGEYRFVDEYLKMWPTHD